MKPRVLSLDPGFADLGYAVISPKRSGVDRVRELGVFSTRANPKKKSIRQAEDTFRRLKELSYNLRRLVQRHSIRAVVFEAMSLPRNASVSAKIGGVYGILSDLVIDLQLPHLEVFPKELKRIVRPGDGVSKVSVETVCREEFGLQQPILALAENVPESLHNHAWDAVGAYLAVRNDSIIASLRR